MHCEKVENFFSEDPSLATIIDPLEIKDAAAARSRFRIGKLVVAQVKALNYEVSRAHANLRVARLFS